MSSASRTPQGTNWVVSTIAGSAGIEGADDGTNEDAQFNSPLGIAASGTGILYVTDSGNNTVRMLAAQGTNWVVSTFAEQAGQYGFPTGETVSAFWAPRGGIAVDANGDVWETDLSFEADLQVLSHSGSAWTLSTFQGYAHPVTFGTPYGVLLAPGHFPHAVDAANNDIATLVHIYSPTTTSPTPRRS